jgi:hypothetical protein
MLGTKIREIRRIRTLRTRARRQALEQIIRDNRASKTSAVADSEMKRPDKAAVRRAPVNQIPAVQQPRVMSGTKETPARIVAGLKAAEAKPDPLAVRIANT